MMRSKTLLAVGILGLTIQPASAATFIFAEDGYSDGATVSGFFTGADTDGDGQISSFAGEVTNFGFSFSGNTAVDAFTLGFPDLFGLVYDLDGTIGNGTALDVEGLLAASIDRGFAEGPALGATCDGTSPCGVVVFGTALDFSTSLIQVAAAAPEPATWAMMITGFGGIGVVMRRRRRAGGDDAFASYA